MTFLAGLLAGHLVTHNIYSDIFSEYRYEVSSLITDNTKLITDASTSEHMFIVMQTLDQLGLKDHVRYVKSKSSKGKKPKSRGR